MRRLLLPFTLACLWVLPGASARAQVLTGDQTYKSESAASAHVSQAAGTQAVLLGDQSVAPSADNNGAGTAQAFAYQASASGTTSAIQFYVNSGTTATKLMLGVYSDASGKPGSLLTSGSVSSPKASAWNDVQIGSATLTKGTTYWIALLATGGEINYMDTWGGSAASYVESNSALTSLPATYSASNEYSASPASAYVEGQTSAPAAPTNSTPPAVTGQTAQDQTLTTSNGSWTGSPTSYTYQWKDCDATGSNCTNISGATSSAYTLQASDVGHTIRSVLTATNSAGSTTASSAATATVTAPAMLVGDQSVAPSADNNGAGTAQAFAYRAGASGTTSDIEFYADSGTTATKLMLGVYSDAGGKPGDLLTSGSLSSPKAQSWNDVTVGSVNLTKGTTYWIALLATGGQIDYPDTWGGSSASYVESNSGLTSLPTVYASGGEYAASPASAYVMGQAAAPTAPTNSAAPAVTGQAVQGQTLTTSNGSWNGSPTSYTYQWRDCNSPGASCTNVSGATSSTYTLQSTDVGKTINSLVTATNAGGSTPATSNTTSTVTGPAPTNTTAPAVTGQAAQGQTVTTSNGSWNGSPTSYAYQWQDCNSSGAGCTNISGATSSSYTLQSSDVGDTLRSIVTACNSNGCTGTASPATAAVAGGSTSSTGSWGDPSFFPIGVWEQSASNAATFKSIGVNYYANASAYSPSDLATIKAAGLVVIECSVNGQDDGSTYLGADGHSYANYSPSTCPHDGRGDPSESAIKGWYVQPDEVDTSQATGANSFGPCIAPSAIKNQTDAIEHGDDLDPHRAVVVSFNSAPAVDTTSRGSFCHYHNDEYPAYMQDATIATFDVYPLNYGFPINSPAVGTSNLHSWFMASGQDKPVITVVETTPIHTGATGPTPAQLHFEIWSSLIAGANGIQYFCHIITPTFEETGCLDSSAAPGIKAQMTSDDSLIESLGSVINSPSLADAAASASAPFKVDTMTKRVGGYEYLFADADAASAGTAAFTVPGGANGPVTVVGENRTLTMTGGQFTDTFGGCSASSCQSSAVHIYKIPYSSYTCPSGVRCFYVANGGSDSNNGTSESTPWAHAPGMPTFTGTYTHQAGDEFIFKGGDTWGNASFPMVDKGSGNSSHPDLFGVDESWFDGSSWTQPVFDAQGSNITGSDPRATGMQDIFIDLRSTDYVTVDNIAFHNWTASNITGGYGSCAVVDLNGDQNVTIDRITVTGMSIDTSGDTATCAVAFGSTNSPSFSGSSVIENSTITGNNTNYGFAVWSLANIENNTISGMTNNVYPSVPQNGTGQISGNDIYNCDSPSAPAGASNLHSDEILVDVTGNPSTLYIHDNVLHDTGQGTGYECESLWVGNPGETDYVWNNVIYGLHGTGPMKVGDNNGGGTTPYNAYIWDNTLTGADDGTTDCIESHTGSTAGVVTAENNLCVSNGGSTFDTSSFTGSPTLTIDHNVLLTTSQMTSDEAQSVGDYATTPYMYLETGNPAPTTGQGVSLASDCAGALVSLCSDTTYAGERPSQLRPGANGWDVGAFQER